MDHDGTLPPRTRPPVKPPRKGLKRPKPGEGSTVTKKSKSSDGKDKKKEDIGDKKKEDIGDTESQTVVVESEGEAVKVSRPLINVSCKIEV